MISLPLYILLIVFGLFMVVFTTFYIINIRDIVTSHAVNGTTFFVVMLITLLSFTTMAIAWQLLANVDWQQPIISFQTALFAHNF